MRKIPATGVAAVLAFVLALACGPSSWAAADDWRATLQPPRDGDAYAPGEALVIKLPEDLEYAVLVRLGVEVDAIDVTALLGFEGNAFVYRPPQPLAPGAHEMRLVEAPADGEVIVRGSWTVEVAAGGGRVALAPGGEPSQPLVASPGQASFSAANGLELNQRIADDGLDNPPSRFTVSGGGYVNGALSQDRWQFDANGNYFVQSETDRAPSGESVDLGEYALASRYDGDAAFGALRLGHQDVGADNLIMSQFRRRGVSATLGDARGRVSATAFGLRADDVVGADDITGLESDDNRLFGGTVTAHPIASLGEDFALSGIYYSGEGREAGASGTGDDTAITGAGWAVVADTYWFERALRLRGEFARNEVDYGATLLGDSEADADATSLLLAFSPVQGEQVAGEYMNLTLGARHERVETFFDSLANPNLAPDRDGVLLYSNLTWGAFSGNVQGLHETNNVDDIEAIPTDRLLNVNASGTYAPTLEPSDSGAPHWLGQPYVTVSVGLSDNDRDETPSGYLGPDTDNQTRSATVGFGSNYPDWNWQLAQTVVRFVDDTDNASDRDSYLTEFAAGWTVSDRLVLNGGLQYGLLRDRTNDADTSTVNVSLGVDAVLLPDTLTAKLDYNLNVLAGSGDTPDNNVVSGEVEWTLLPARSNRPGVALALQGLLEDNDGNADPSLDGTAWQVFTVLRFSAPLAD